MLLKKPGKKTAWIIAGVSALMVFASAGVVWLDWQKITTAKTEAAGLRGQIEKANARIQKVPDIEVRVLRERSRLKELVRILPDDGEINDFVDRISDFAKASGVEVQSMDDRSAKTRSQRKNAETFLRITYKMSIRGTFAQFLDFTNRLETFERFVKVNYFSLKSEAKQGGDKGEATGPQQHSAEIEVETYIYNPTKEGGKAQVEILNADQKLARALRTDPLGDLNIVLDSYRYTPNPERRDPFADPRKSENESVEVKSPESTEAEKAIIDELTAKLKKVREAVEAESAIQDLVKRIEYTKRLNSEIAALKDRIQTIKKTETPFASKELAERFLKEIDEPFVKLIAGRPDAAPDLLAHELENQLKKMNTAFDAGQFADVVAISKTLLSSKPAEPDPVLAGLFTKVETVARRAEARVEFAEKSLRFGGLVFKHARPKEAVIIINDRAYAVGEAMDDGVVVRAIEPSKVTFLYKREEIVTAID